MCSLLFVLKHAAHTERQLRLREKKLLNPTDETGKTKQAIRAKLPQSVMMKASFLDADQINTLRGTYRTLKSLNIELLLPKILRRAFDVGSSSRDQSFWKCALHQWSLRYCAWLFFFCFRSLESLLFGHQSSAHQGTGITGNSAIKCWHALYT